MRTYADELGAMIGRWWTCPPSKKGTLSFSEVYKQVGFKFGSYATSRQAIAGADIIIDATPLGMKAGDPAPFDTALLSADQTVFDVVYGHGETGAGPGGPGGGVPVFRRCRHARRPGRGHGGHPARHRGRGGPRYSRGRAVPPYGAGRRIRARVNELEFGGSDALIP